MTEREVDISAAIIMACDVIQKNGKMPPDQVKLFQDKIAGLAVLDFEDFDFTTAAGMSDAVFMVGAILIERLAAGRVLYYRAEPLKTGETPETFNQN